MTGVIRSGNGWRVEPPGSDGLTTIRFRGVSHRVKRGREGSAANAMLWLAEELHKIEPVNEVGWDGTYAYRAVRGATTWSDHASGTAWDWNASQHPMGGSRYAGWSSTQVAKIRAMLNTPRGKAFRWGADYRRPDSMHFSMVSPEKFESLEKLFL